MLKGIDISYWQRDQHKSQIDNFGKDFVICRAAFSKSVDAYCDQMYQYAKAKGRKLGFYFFPLTSDGTPEACAEWAYKQVLGYIGEAVPILDWEAYQNTAVHDHRDVNWALRWLKKFEELSGVKPIIYMNSSLEQECDWSQVVKADYGLWIANYGNNDGSDHGKPVTKHWKVVAMHQYTSRGDGRSLDCNTFYGDRSTWDTYCGKKQNAGATVPTYTPPAPTKKNNEESAKEIIAKTCSDSRWDTWGDNDTRISRLSLAGYDHVAVQNVVNKLWAEMHPYTTYTVRSGDSLSSIATKFGTNFQKLAKENKIVNANLIYPGQIIKIYK